MSNKGDWKHTFLTTFVVSLVIGVTPFPKLQMYYLPMTACKVIKYTWKSFFMICQGIELWACNAAGQWFLSSLRWCWEVNSKCTIHVPNTVIRMRLENSFCTKAMHFVIFYYNPRAFQLSFSSYEVNVCVCHCVYLLGKKTKIIIKLSPYDCDMGSIFVVNFHFY